MKGVYEIKRIIIIKCISINMNCVRLFGYFKSYLCYSLKRVIVLDAHKICCTEFIFSFIAYSHDYDNEQYYNNKSNSRLLKVYSMSV